MIFHVYQKIMKCLKMQQRDLSQYENYSQMIEFKQNKCPMTVNGISANKNPN